MSSRRARHRHARADNVDLAAFSDRRFGQVEAVHNHAGQMAMRARCNREGI
jgi:hypothetical protein